MNSFLCLFRSFHYIDRLKETEGGGGGGGEKKGERERENAIWEQMLNKNDD